MRLLWKTSMVTLGLPIHRSELFFAACGVEMSETTICRAINKHLSHHRKMIDRNQLGKRAAENGVAFCAEWARQPDLLCLKTR
jgi:hypothetical protein